MLLFEELRHNQKHHTVTLRSMTTRVCPSDGGLFFLFLELIELLELQSANIIQKVKLA